MHMVETMQLEKDISRRLRYATSVCRAHKVPEIDISHLIACQFRPRTVPFSSRTVDTVDEPGRNLAAERDEPSARLTNPPAMGRTIGLADDSTRKLAP